MALRSWPCDMSPSLVSAQCVCVCVCVCVRAHTHTHTTSHLTLEIVDARCLSDGKRILTNVCMFPLSAMLMSLHQVLSEDTDLAAAAARARAGKTGSTGGTLLPEQQCAKAADAEKESDELFYYRLEHAGDADKAGPLGAEEAEEAEEEEVELDPDTMLPIVKGQQGLFVVGEEEEEEELDPDTMMPIKKTKGAKPPPVRQFVSFRARKLTGWTAPTGARLICVDDDGNEDEGDINDNASEASGRTNVSNYEIPRNEEHSIDLRRRTDRVMQTKAAAYVYGGNRQRGGLDSFEGRIRARYQPFISLFFSLFLPLSGSPPHPPSPR